MKRITCFIPFQNITQANVTVNNLKKESQVADIYLLKTPESSCESIEGCKIIETSSLKCTDCIKKIAEAADTDYSLIYTKYSELSFVLYAVDRMLTIADDTNAAMVYADYFNKADNTSKEMPLIDYQMGSLRDDFDFGSVLLYRTDSLKNAAARMDVDYNYGALYDLRLKVSQNGKLEHINEYLYYEIETDNRKSGEKIFDWSKYAPGISRISTDISPRHLSISRLLMIILSMRHQSSFRARTV